ncbi:MAG TPA: hypothetical protein VG323_13345 [Thermoanaerobaculia bacterium]|nr:hypothetical protein [Thermoanaerobaculia bacterium]
MIGVFVVHELVTQRRSGRFRALAFLYVALASLPAIAVFAVSARAKIVIGSATYAAVTGAVQPLLTALLAAAIAIDAFTRERDEGSFAVLAVAPLSSAGYLARRWLAVVAVCLPLTLLPPLIAAALAARAQHTAPLASAFAATWLLDVVPPLLVASALAIALGTIAGRTVVAIVFAALLLTFGLEMANDLFAYRHHHFDGPAELFGMRPMLWMQMRWALRGWWSPPLPSEAAHPFLAHMRNALPRAATGAALAAIALGIAAHMLRRSRRDLRPWRIPAGHRFRSFLRFFNSIREEYAPDAGASRADWLALAAGIAVAAGAVMLLLHQESAFAMLAKQRYTSETEAPSPPTPATIVPLSLRIDARVETNGRVAAHSSLTIRNDGTRAESHLAFDMNPGLALLRIGGARAQRLWQRIDAELEPPLAPKESRTLEIDAAGVPSTIDFALPGIGTGFAQHWHFYERAKRAVDLSDLTRSTIDPRVSEVRMQLDAADLAPVLRYADDAFSPPLDVGVRVQHPFAFAADACGSVAAGAPLVSRCTMPLASYRIFGAPLRESALGSSATLATIAAHETLARTHGPALAASIALARSWPGLELPPHVIFVERPTEADDRHWRGADGSDIAARGALVFVPEPAFCRLEPLDGGAVAAALVSRTLAARRRVVPEQATFFASFFDLVAARRLGGRKGSAVVPGIGAAPDTQPIVSMRERWWGALEAMRLGRVLADVEHRVGADHLAEGVNDFVAAGPAPGTAKELIGDIGRRGGVDLDRVYRDYFESSALPQLTLANVVFRGTVVTGELRNDGSGEALAPIVLRSAGGSQWRTLRVDGGQRVAFSFTADSEPRTLQLDPDKVCYRYAAVGTVESVDK